MTLTMAEMAKAENAAAKLMWSAGDAAALRRVVPARLASKYDEVFEEIVAKVSEETGISVKLIMGNSRKRPIARSRQFAMYKALETGATTAEVGRFFRRDHSTVCHAASTVKKILKGNAPEVRA
jgi:chromosomal replication initiation ATPase DnaA